MFKYFFKILTIIFIITGIAACSGGGGSSDTVVPEAQALKSVTGVFVDDAPIARAVITIIDAAGVTREVTTDDNGLYYIEVNDLELPLLVVGSYTSGGVVHTQYSFVSADKSSADTVTANINEYSSLLVSAMTQEAGVVIDTAPESLSDTNRNLILGIDYLPAIASMESLFCSVLLNPDGTPQGCEWGSSEDILTTSYIPTVDGTSLDKLVALMDVTVDTSTGDIIIADSSGAPVATISLNDIVADTIPVDTLTQAAIENINTFYTPPTEIVPLENEVKPAKLTTSGTVRGFTRYVSVFPDTDVFVDNLTECPVESRNFMVTPTENAEIQFANFAEYNPETDTSPELLPTISRATIKPIDACRSYAFDYQFDYNMVIRKTQTGLIDGVPVWKYDVPACEQYSNKTIEEIYQKTYQYTDVDFDLLFNQPAIEVRPALNRFSDSWPGRDSSVNFVYDPTCPMIAEFSATPLEGTPSLTVNVDASNSVGNLVSYEWEVTGGQTATDKTASFTFDTAGTYTITLTVTDTNGQTDVLSKTVIVDPFPQASFTSTLGSASNQIKLNAVNSTGAGISYSWTASEAIDGITRKEQNVNFTFAAPGDYTVTLVVTDKYGTPSEPLSKVVTVEEITDGARKDSYNIVGDLIYDQTTGSVSEGHVSFDVLSNDIGNLGKITRINGELPSNYYGGVQIDGATLKISADGKKVWYATSIGWTGWSMVKADFSFTYTVEDLSSGGTFTGNVNVVLNPDKIIDKSYGWNNVSRVQRGPCSADYWACTGYTSIQKHGEYESFWNLDYSQTATNYTYNWVKVVSTAYANGLREGAHLEWDTSDGELSTCVNTVGQFSNNVESGTWYWYWASYITHLSCDLSSTRTY